MLCLDLLYSVPSYNVFRVGKQLKPLQDALKCGNVWETKTVGIQRGGMIDERKTFLRNIVWHTVSNSKMYVVVLSVFAIYRYTSNCVGSEQCHAQAIANGFLA